MAGAGGVRQRQGASSDEEEKKGPVVIEGAVKKKDVRGIITRGSNHEFAQPRIADEEEGESMAYVFHASSLHMMGLAFFGLVATRFAQAKFGSGELLGISDENWFTASIMAPAAHQVIIWLVWRAQMCYGVLTKYLGAPNDLKVWRYVFSTLTALRVVTFLGAAISSQDTMISADWRGNPNVTPGLLKVLGVASLVPALYTIYSVWAHFDWDRFIGGDHFRERYRRLPKVTAGAFKYTSNAMYLFGFMLLWGIAAIFNSRAAFGSALFSHTTVWLHFLCTELPDMKMLYGSMADVKNGGNVTNLKNPQRATRN